AVEGVSPALRAATRELPAFRIEAIEKIAIQTIEPAEKHAPLLIPAEAVEADPAMKPRRIGHQIAVVPAPGNLVAPPGQRHVAKFVSLHAIHRVHLGSTAIARQRTTAW